MRYRKVVWPLVVVAVLMAGLPASAAAQVPPHRVIDSWVTVAGDTRLRMQVGLPKMSGPVPTLLVYQGYTHHRYAVGEAMLTRILQEGYAVMVVSIRGTACSEGEWDFLSEREARDGRDVIEWIADQPWSDGKVAMIGESYSGFEQLPTAALQPEPLVAISPAAPIADLYRDVAYPGGVPNSFVPTAVTATLQAGWIQSLLTSGDPNHPDDQACGLNLAARPASLPGSPAVLAATHPWDDDLVRTRAPGASIERIDVPTLGLVAWQDELLGSRALGRLSEVSGPFHAVVTNGDHTHPWTSERFRDRLFEFLDFYVKGRDNGFGDRPRIEVWWEMQRPAPHADTPRWTTGHPRLPPPNARMREFFLDGGGSLTAAPGVPGADRYTYVGGTGQYVGSATNPATIDPTTLQPVGFSDAPAPGAAVAYTSAPLDKDLTVLGSGSVDLWLSSSAPDTDLQIVLTEVRPDGQEQYVQAGWLRASHRREDPARSTPARPFHTHRREDAAPLTPGVPARMRVEVLPVGHVFRAGSRLRLWIEAPARVFGAWSRDAIPGPAVNTVHRGSAHPSSLRLTTIPSSAPVEPAPCGTVVRQPCRPAAP